MSIFDKCPICSTDCKGTGIGPLNQIYHIECPVCRAFRITTDAISGISPCTEHEKGLICGFVRGSHDRGLVVELRKTHIESIISGGPSDMLQKLDRLLVSLAKLTERLGQPLPLAPAERGLGYTINIYEFESQINNLIDLGYLNREHRTGADPTMVSVSVRGLDRVQKLRETRGWESNRAFVAMWFDGSMQHTYERGLKAGIEAAGYEAMRIDQIEHNDLIDDRIVAGLRECRFVVADYTNHRNGVYYEAGFAHGMGKTVIMCCREEDKTEIHFDINHRNFVLYESPEDLAQKLKVRILATVWAGDNYKPEQSRRSDSQ